MFSEDLSGFLVSGELGDIATIAGVDVRGVFDRPYVETLDHAGHRPTFTCASDDVLGVSRGDAVFVDGITYTVVGIEPDGTGLTTLILSE